MHAQIFSTNGQYVEGSFIERNLNGMFILSMVMVLYGGIRPTKLLFKRISNILVTYQ